MAIVIEPADLFTRFPDLVENALKQATTQFAQSDK